jgi:CRISPR-associated protein Cas1
MKTLLLYDDGLYITKNNERINVTREGATVFSLPIISISDILIMGNVQITAQAMRFLTSNNVNITHANKAGRLYGFTNNFNETRCTLRLLQYKAFSDEQVRLDFAKEICKGKISEQLLMLRHSRREFSRHYTQRISRLFESVDSCVSVNHVLGTEGRAAKIYFDAVSRMSSFSHRSRRPATDPFNALLNLTYSLVLNRITSVLATKGFDVCIGFLHSIKNGRPSLSLDLLEYFRPRVDKFVIKITNLKEFSEKDFVVDETSGGYYLSNKSFSRFMTKYEKAFSINGDIESLANRFIKALKTNNAEVLNEKQLCNSIRHFKQQGSQEAV